jgi:hypothetical protein
MKSDFNLVKFISEKLLQRNLSEIKIKAPQKFDSLEDFVINSQRGDEYETEGGNKLTTVKVEDLGVYSFTPFDGSSKMVKGKIIKVKPNQAALEKYFRGEARSTMETIHSGYEYELFKTFISKLDQAI